MMEKIEKVKEGATSFVLAVKKRPFDFVSVDRKMILW
jgi:hypothetical protein